MPLDGYTDDYNELCRCCAANITSIAARNLICFVKHEVSYNRYVEMECIYFRFLRTKNYFQRIFIIQIYHVFTNEEIYYWKLF